MSLAHRKILLGVTGGIAAYKSADLVRRLKEAGAEVQVVMTAGARAFVTPLTFQAVSGREVRTDLLDPTAEAGMGHIELARWADLILIAPASANFMQRLAHGAADDLLTTLCLATDAPIALAPAMNRLMWANPATQANAETLQSRGVQLWGPGAGEQACGEVGAGRMLEPLELVAQASAAFGAGELVGQRVLVTAGPTREAIDPVRFITNRSSGRMGYAVAEACAAAGAQVTLVSGPVTLPPPAGVTLVSVESAEQMHHAVMQAADSTSLFIAAAAVADYRPEQVRARKLKKQPDDLALALTRTRDILAEVSARFPNIFCVGFAAETDELERYARAKLESKKLDMIAANWVGENRAFGRDDNALSVFWPGGGRELAQAPKKVLARQLVGLIAERMNARDARAQAI